MKFPSLKETAVKVPPMEILFKIENILYLDIILNIHIAMKTANISL